MVQYLLWLCERLISAHPYFPPQPCFKSLGHFILFQPTHCGSFHFSGCLPPLLRSTESWTEKKKVTFIPTLFSIILPLARRKSSSTYVITRLKRVSGQMKKNEMEECGERRASWLRNVHTPWVPWAVCLLQDRSCATMHTWTHCSWSQSSDIMLFGVFWQRSNRGSKRKSGRVKSKPSSSYGNWFFAGDSGERGKKKGMSSFLNLKLTVQGKCGQMYSHF